MKYACNSKPSIGDKVILYGHSQDAPYLVSHVESNGDVLINRGGFGCLFNPKYLLLVSRDLVETCPSNVILGPWKTKE